METKHAAKTPVKRDNADRGAEPHAPKHPAKLGRGEVSILIVDDTPENLIAIEAVLSDIGRLVKVTSGQEALRMLLKEEFAVILLDVNMPGMNGFETAALIRQRKNTEHVPIIFVTAISTTDTHMFKGYSLGAVDYIFTPVNAEVLRSKVSVFVELVRKSQAVKLQAKQLQEANEILRTEIDTRKKAEEALKESNEELEAFSYSVSHDLRAPVRAMQGFARVLVEDYGEKLDEAARDYLDRIVAGACRMDSLIQDLLVYSRLGHTELSLGPISLKQLISEIVRQIAPEINSKNAEISVADDLPEVVANKMALGQAIENLITNGLKFVPEDRQAKVRIEAQTIGKLVRLWIIDNGIGIPDEHHSRIFRVFERLHTADTYPGTGIGLAIVRKGVERMNGHVGLESEVGKGSRFWIELPAATAPAPAG
ncbi:MAG TPA: ATP-binding protein [Verrucomicrobiae bacterium]|jgi:signal transduction histidine kinase